MGQIGGAVIGGGGSNTGVKNEGVKVRDTARFLDFGEDFVVTKIGRENVSVSLSSSDANSVQKSGGNNAMVQKLNMSKMLVTCWKVKSL
mgnify:CR=1 FL=1